MSAYRKAAQAAPNNTSYRIALERTMLAASRDWGWARLHRAAAFRTVDTHTNGIAAVNAKPATAADAPAKYAGAEQ